MSEGAGNRIPKTLADVSHLFFSNVEERPDAAATADATATQAAAQPSALEQGPRATRVLLVTGGGDTPGKSTVAVNLAQALLPRGRVALFDADPRLPNARFYLGFPSWSYLSPITGGGTPARSTVTDSGLIVVDWSADGGGPAASWGAGEGVRLDVGETGPERLDYAVIDAPAERAGRLGLAEGLVSSCIVVAAPGWRGFTSAFAAAALLARDIGATAIDLVVNRAPSDEYVDAYHAKFSQASRELLSVETRLLVGVGVAPGLGSDQRERGPIVRSRPDAAVALALRQAAATAASRAGAESDPGGRPAVCRERGHERESPEVGAS